MKSKLFNNLVLFSLFGIALGFFGILYEGLVYGPKLLDASMERMLFWKNFTSIISPVVYYVPIVYLATITSVVLYFKTPKQKAELKKKLKSATIFQIASLVLTIYILTQINFKLSFGNLEKYADAIPAKAILYNILSVFRIALAAIGLTSIFKAYIQTQQGQT
jgi:heme/copper-type cytochrome/quinol oxidase subunit 2